MKRYTSDSSPLRIAELLAPAVTGRIGMSICPGKKGPSASNYCWDRDLETDVSVIAQWPAAAVVTLLEASEFNLLRVNELGAKVRAHGLEWFTIQITDGGVPDERFDAAWPGFCRRLCAMLQEGSNVMIHCRGGLGRTGMIAALLLMELGVNASDAIRQVRTARPGAIETDEQAAFVMRYRTLLR